MKINKFVILFLLTGQCFSQSLSNTGIDDTTNTFINLLNVIKNGLYIEPGITFISYDSKEVVDLSNINNIAPAAYLNTNWYNGSFGRSEQHKLSIGAGLMLSRGTTHDDTLGIAKELLLPSNLSINLFSNYRFSFDEKHEYNLYAFLIGGVLKNTALELSDSNNKFTVNSTSYAFGFGLEIKNLAAMILYRNSNSRDSQQLKDLLGVTDLKRQTLSFAFQFPISQLKSFAIINLRQYIGGQIEDKFGTGAVITITLNTPLKLFNKRVTGGSFHMDKVPPRTSKL